MRGVPMNIEPISNEERLAVWNFDSSAASDILYYIALRKNILITGPAGCGKTSLLKDLISLTDPSERFGFIYRTVGAATYGERDIHPWDIHRVNGSLNLGTADDFEVLKLGTIMLPDFFVMDDIGAYFEELTARLAAMDARGSFATKQLNVLKQREFFNTQFFRDSFYDMVIYLEKYHQGGLVFTMEHPQTR